MKRILAITIILTLLFSTNLFSIAMQGELSEEKADTALSMDDKERNQMEKEQQLELAKEHKFYEISFEGVSAISKSHNKNLESLQEYITEVIYTVDAGEDIFTIGHSMGVDKKSTQEELRAEVLSAIADINTAIETTGKLPGNEAIVYDQLALTSVKLTIPNDLAKTVTPSLEELEGAKRVEIIDGAVLADSLQSEATNAAESAAQQAIAQAMTTNYAWHISAGVWYDRGTTKTCPTIAPHKGDGNARFRDGNPWYPDDAEAEFYIQTSSTNRTELWYCYSETQLNHMAFVDNNEALELEIIYYNYKNASQFDLMGRTFQSRSTTETWSSNQPNCYKDTTLFDNSDEVSFCVGVYDAQSLKSNKWYYWQITGPAGASNGAYPNDGRFRVVAQRSYRTTPFSTSNPALCVFAEEHDKIIRMGITSSMNWEHPARNAWYFARTSGAYWIFNGTIS